MVVVPSARVTMEENEIVVSMISGALSIIASATEDNIVAGLKELNAEERRKITKAVWMAESLPNVTNKEPSIHEELGSLGQ